MQFYKLTNNSIYSRGWTWAWSLIPRLDTISSVCDVCHIGRLYPGRYPERSLGVAVEGGTKYPDVLGCGSYPLLIVSAQVIADWKKNDVSGYREFLLTVTKSQGKKIEVVTPPQYFHIEVSGRCLLDLEAMGVDITYQCPKCGYTRKNPTNGFPFIVRQETWDGSDLFISELFPQSVFCTQKVFDLAASNRRTNFCFKQPGDNWMSNEGCINYMPTKSRRLTQKP